MEPSVLVAKVEAVEMARTDRSLRSTLAREGHLDRRCVGFRRAPRVLGLAERSAHAPIGYERLPPAPRRSAVPVACAGIRELRASVLPANKRAMHVLSAGGWRVLPYESGFIEYGLSLSDQAHGG